MPVFYRNEVYIMYSVEFMKCKLVKEKDCPYEYICTVSDAASVLIDLGLHEASEEYVYLLCLNCKGMITAIHEVAHGVLSECPMSSRTIYTRALLNNAASIIIAHNHPSGDSSPSQADIEATKRIREVGALFEIPVIDHLIIASDSSYYSFKENEMI